MSAAPIRDQSSGLSTSRALVPFVAVPKLMRSWSLWQVGLLAAAFGIAAGLGGVAAYEGRHLLFNRQPAQSATALHRLEDQVGRLQQSIDNSRVAADATRSDEAIRGLKRSVEGLKQDIEQVRASGAATMTQLATKIEKVDHDPSAKLAEIASRLDRIEKLSAPKPVAAVVPAPAPAPLPKPVAALSTQAPLPTAAAPAPKPSASVAGLAPHKIVAPAPAQAEETQVSRTGSLPPVSAQPALTAWVVRDVYDGVALVEGRDGGLREVGPGQYLPGAGQVRSIERHGRNWVVLTSRGVINATF